MNETWTDIHNDISTATQPEDVLIFLRKADDYDEDTRERILSSGLDRLWDLEYSDFESVLLEQCALRSGYEGHTIHVLLKRWLEENPTQRDDVICRLLPELDKLDTLRVQNVLWTFIFIGYRDEALQRKLLAFVTAPPDEQTKYIALWGLVWLGYSDRSFLEETIQKVLEDADVVPELVLRCGSQLASLKLLPYFQECLLHAKFPPNTKTEYQNLLYVLSDTAQAHPQCASVVWDTLLQYASTREDGVDALYDVLKMASEITRGIDDGRVVDFFLHRLEPDAPQYLREQGRMSNHYHPYLRLGNLQQSQQLAVMSTSLSCADAPTRDKVTECLYQDAIVDTGNKGAWQTQLTLIKEHSWNTILRLNLPEARQWLVEAFQETSDFALADICRWVGLLRVTEATSILHELIKRTDWREPGGTHTEPGLAALRALGSIGTKEAFEALTESQVAFKVRSANGSIPATTPLQHGEAFRDCVLTMQDVALLIDCLEQSPAANPRCWIACAFALQQVMFATPALITPHRERVFALLHRADVVEADHLYLHYLLPSLGGLDKDERTETLLLDWACGADRKAMEAIEVLARWGVLHSHPNLLNQIGLEPAEQSTWKVTRSLTDREAFILGILFWNYPDTFTPSVHHLIENGSYQEAVQVFQQLSAENASAAILDALTRRAYRVNKQFQAETEALWTLRRIMPERFMKEFRYEKVFNWPASAREAIVTAYRDINSKEASHELTKFLIDGVYTIRRVAARTLANLDLSRLDTEAKHLLDSENVHHRVCGVEATAWLEDEEAFQSLYKQARHDREVNVRNAANETVKMRRRVILARAYLQYVLDTSADQLTTTWQYGQALQQVGDEETLRLLRKAADDVNRRPNQRAYLQYLHEQVQKGWEEWQRKRNDRLEE